MFTFKLLVFDFELDLTFYHLCLFALVFVCAVVCFLSDRDWLRERVIQWVQEEVGSDDLTSNASSTNEILQTYFKVTTFFTLLI